MVQQYAVRMVNFAWESVKGTHGSLFIICDMKALFWWTRNLST